MFRLLAAREEPPLEQIAEFQFSDDAKLLFDSYVKQKYRYVQVVGRGMFYSDEVLYKH